MQEAQYCYVKGENIKKLEKALNWTHDRIARRAMTFLGKKMCYTTVSRIINRNERKHKLKYVKAISKSCIISRPIRIYTIQFNS